MYALGSDWKLRIDEARTSKANQGELPNIPAIEPDVVFTKNTIGFLVTTVNGKQRWYRGGELLQVFESAISPVGFSQGERIECVLNRNHAHRFTTFPQLGGDSRYLISYVPPPWYPDVRIRVWEYVGGNEGATLDSLAQLQKQTIQKINGLRTSVNALTKKVDKLSKKTQI